jgi:hypothetical protein
MHKRDQQTRARLAWLAVMAAALTARTALIQLFGGLARLIHHQQGHLPCRAGPAASRTGLTGPGRSPGGTEQSGRRRPFCRGPARSWRDAGSTPAGRPWRQGQAG